MLASIVPITPTLLAAGDFDALIAIFVIVALAILAILLVIKNVLYVCQPNEVLIFSGRRRPVGDKVLGYRILRGGRTIRIPLFETVDRMDLTNMIIELQVRNAYSKGGIPLDVQGIANIKVPGEEPLLYNTLERFLGKSREEIMKTARETLEGNLRGVLATLTPEQVNRDKQLFASKLTEEAEHDLSRVGLVLDTLNIQNISDEVGYLDAIGRQRSAQIRRAALIAEAGAQAQAAEQKWTNTRNAELASIEAQIKIVHKETERRIADAETGREAMIARQQAEVQALIAQATAEVQMQEARIEQVRRRLQADVIQPAEAQRQEAVQVAKGNAAQIVEQGRATAQALAELATTYRGSGSSGRDVLLMQKLVPLMRTVSGTIGDLKVDRLTVLPSAAGLGGDGDGPLAAKLVGYAEQIKAATGVDVPKIVRDRFADEPARRSPPPARS
ncbi:MAG: flotillin family protein [Myxococcales bacterium]|nr:flotillin family protein [Myxococcales bacterium]